MALPYHLLQWRRQTRAELLARRAAIGRTQRSMWSAEITRHVTSSFSLLQWMTIGIYWPLKGEIDPRFAARHFRDRGATAALPVVVQKNAPLEFRTWWPGAPTLPGVFNLPVPQGTAVVRPHALLIPPIGFDSAGYRLGYGGGYFDRTLAALTPQPLKVAVAFELSRIDSIDPQPHDIPMDFVVTERGVYCVEERGLRLLTAADEVVALASTLIEERFDAPSSCSEDAPIEPARVRGYTSPPCYAAEHERDGFCPNP